MSSLPVTISIALLLGTVACSGKQNDATPESAPTTAPVVEPAIPAVDITGSYLTMDCARFDPLLALKTSDAKDEILGCILKTRADGKRFDGTLSDLAGKIVQADGAEVAVRPLPTREQLGWQLAVAITKESYANLKALRISGTAAASNFDSEAGTVRYDTSGDPSFGPEWLARVQAVLYRTLRSVPDQNCAVPPDFVGETWTLPLSEDFLNQPYQLAFVTAEIYPAAKLGGIVGADAICQATGARIDLANPGRVRQWRAVLSTSAEDARKHVPITAPVFNTAGYLVAKDAATFWSPQEDQNPTVRVDRYVVPDVGSFAAHVGLMIDECAIEVGSLHNSLDVFNIKMSNAWTGTAPGGTLTAGRTCGDWTSTSAQDAATAGLVYAGNDRFLDNRGPPSGCTDENHIYCVSVLAN